MGRIIGLKGLILPRFDEEIRHALLDLESKVVLTRQFEEGQERGDDKLSRLVLDEFPEGHLRFTSETADDVLLLLLNGVLNGLHLVDRLIILVFHFENAPEGLDQFEDRSVEIYVVALFHPFSVVGRIAPNEVFATALASGRQLVGGFFETNILEEPLDELASRIDGLSLLVGLL